MTAFDERQEKNRNFQFRKRLHLSDGSSERVNLLSIPITLLLRFVYSRVKKEASQESGSKKKAVIIFHLSQCVCAWRGEGGEEGLRYRSHGEC